MDGIIEDRPRPGEHLMVELKWVHDAIRCDLEVCEELADDVASGVNAGNIAGRVEGLRNGSVLWRLRVSCLTYCRFVHLHHRNEDVNIFPALREAEPSLGPVVDRLEKDHRRVSDLLDEIEDATRALAATDGAPDRSRLSGSLRELGGYLLDHLAFEEEAIAPTVLKWEKWPGH